MTIPRAIADAQRMKIELINLSPAGGFVVAFQVAIYGGMVLASPFIFYFIAAFVFPALKMRERKYIYRGLAIGGGLFLTGVAFCYFALMPVALAASQMYSHWLGFGALQWRAEDYISFVCKFMLGMGLGFELPVVILTLVKIGVLDYRHAVEGAPLHDRHQPDSRRGADDAGGPSRSSSCSCRCKCFTKSPSGLRGIGTSRTGPRRGGDCCSRCWWCW